MKISSNKFEYDCFKKEYSGNASDFCKKSPNEDTYNKLFHVVDIQSGPSKGLTLICVKNMEVDYCIDEIIKFKGVDIGWVLKPTDISLMKYPHMKGSSIVIDDI